MIIVVIILLSILMALLLWQYIDLLKQNIELKGFKFHLITNPNYLSLFKTDQVFPNGVLEKMQPIIITEGEEESDQLSILASVNCAACETLVKNLLASEILTLSTGIKLYIVPKVSGYDYSKIQQLTLEALGDAYSNSFGSYISKEELPIEGMKNAVPYSPMMLLNGRILNYKYPIQELLFTLK